jgi:MFS family permease
LRRPAGSHDPYAAFRERDFRLFMIGSFLVQIGTGAQSVAVGWEIYRRTGDALALGLTGLVQAAPMILLTLPAGYLADIASRRLLIALAMAGSAVASAGLAAGSLREAPVAAMYLLLLLDSVFNTLARPARLAILPTLVPRARFENAMSWRISVQQVSGVAGPALGGILAAVSTPAVYVCAAATTLLFAACVSVLRAPREKHPGGAPSLATVLAGVRFAWEQPLLLTTMALDLFAVLLGGAVYLLPVYARDVLAAGEQGLGWLRAAPAVGSFCMALLLAHLPPMRRAGRNLLLAVAGFGLATIVFGLSRTFWLSWAMLFFTGLFNNVSVVVRHTLQQMLAPDEMRGRVSAVTSIFISSSNELGGFESGLVARLFSPVVSVVSGGIGTLCVVAVATLASPALRRFGSLSSVRAAALAPAATPQRAKGQQGET